MGLSTRKSMMRLVLFILMSTLWLSGQEVLSLHKAVGTFIDPAENEQYNLFPEVPHFIHARCIQLSSGQIIAQIRYSADGSIKTRVKALDSAQYQQLVEQITQANKQPSRANEAQFFYPPQVQLANEIPPNRFCEIRLKDGTRTQGVYYRYQQNQLYFWQDKQLESIPIRDIARLKYYADYHRNKRVLWGSVMISALCGELVVNWLSRAINISSSRRIFNATLGATLGTVLGYHAFPIINKHLLLSYSIDFKHNRKTLDPFHNLLYSIKNLKRSIWQKKDA